MIYFIQSEDGTGPIKIGTSIRLSERLRQLCNEVGCNLRVLAVAEGSFPEERDLHRRFTHLRVVNEWFEPGDDLVGFIVTEGRQWDGADEASPRNDVSVRIDAEAVRIAKIVAAYRDVSLAEYISGMVLEIAKRDLAEEQSRAKFPDQPPKR